MDGREKEREKKANEQVHNRHNQQTSQERAEKVEAKQSKSKQTMGKNEKCSGTDWRWSSIFAGFAAVACRSALSIGHASGIAVKNEFAINGTPQKAKTSTS